MKEVISTVILVLVLALVNSSCELVTEINYDTLAVNNRIVVNGFISKTNGIQFLIKSTVPPNKTNLTDSIKAFNVRLFNDEVIVAEWENCHSYILEDILPPGIESKNLYIEIEADGYETVKSENINLVEMPKIDTAFVVNDTINWKRYVEVHFKDLSDSVNYYAINVTPYKDGETMGRSERIIPLNYFTEGGFKDTIISQKVIYSSDFDSIHVTLFNCSEEYAKLIDSEKLYEGTISDYYQEKINMIYTNITNGYGFFCAYEYDIFNVVTN